MKIKRFILLLIAALTLTGCSSKARLNDTSYLRAAAIDGINEKKLSFAFFTDNDSVASSKGTDIDSAKKAAELSGGKVIFTGYTELVILGDCDYRKILESLLNDWKVPPSCLVVRSDSDIESFEDIDLKRLIGSIKRATEQGIAPQCDIVTVLEKLLDDSENTEIPRISELRAAEAAILPKHGGDDETQINSDV